MMCISVINPNISIHTTFYRNVSECENLGSGFPLMLSAWNGKHWLKRKIGINIDRQDGRKNGEWVISIGK